MNWHPYLHVSQNKLFNTLYKYESIKTTIVISNYNINNKQSYQKTFLSYTVTHQALFGSAVR